MVDTTIPGTSAEIVTVGPNAPIGSAGIICIVGRFEKGNGNTPYYISNANDGLAKMGSNANYPGSKLIELAFKKDIENNNYGAISVIAIKAGESLGATCTLVDTTADTPVDVMELTLSGGTWGNSVTATIASGTNSGKKLTLKKGTTILEVFDNCADAEALFNKLKGYSSIVTKVEAKDLTKTLKDVADSPFSDGTEVADPTTTDISDALTTLMTENFDEIIFTDIPDDSFYASIKAYLDDRVNEDKFTTAVLPIDITKTAAQAKTLVNTINSGLITWIFQTFTIGTEELDEVQSAAGYAAFIAGLPVYESCTNKILNNIDALNQTFNSTDTYDLTDSGITVFELKDRQNNKFGVVSAVTGSHTVGDDGKKTAWSEQHAVRSLFYVCKQLDMKTYLGNTGISKTKSAIDGEINNRVKTMLEPANQIAEKIEVTTAFDEGTSKLLNMDIEVVPLGILKHIHKRISMQEA